MRATAMGDFDRDTTLDEKSDGTLTVNLSRDWSFAVPNGGFLGALCLRAASHTAPKSAPISIACTFLGNASEAAGPVTLRPTALLAPGKSAQAIEVVMSQGEQLILRATIWVRANVKDGVGLAHNVIEPPSRPPVRDVPLMSELPPERRKRHFPFWDNFEERVVGWQSPKAPSPPEWLGWYRLQPPRSTFDNVWVAASRSLLLIDALALATCIRAHPDKMALAMTTQTNMSFFASPEIQCASEWLLTRVEAPIAERGVLFARGEVWSEKNELLALGDSSLLFLTAPMRR
jgi:acyl-CoA thioesterase